MINIPLRVAGILAGGALLIAVATPAGAQPAGFGYASQAYAISAGFASSSMSTELPPVDEASGSVPPPYDITKSLAAFSQTIAIPPLIPGPDIPPVAASFTATATKMKSQVSSAGIQLDFVSATGKSSIGTANLTITNTIPPGSTLPVLLYLGVTASKVVTTADYSQTFPQPPTVSGTASFGALSITGSLVGGKTITYAGAAPPNTILYQSPVASTDAIPAVTITAHQQVTVGLISCEPTCVFTPDRIDVQGLNVSLYKAMINGFPVTGTIILGAASAQ